MTSTNEAVGPATYMPEKVVKTSNIKTGSKWTFPRAPRKEMAVKTYDRHQTYDSRRAIGKQAISTKKNAPEIKFGQESRDAARKLGVFKSAMTQQQAKIVIAHPKF